MIELKYDEKGLVPVIVKITEQIRCLCRRI